MKRRASLLVNAFALLAASVAVIACTGKTGNTITLLAEKEAKTWRTKEQWQRELAANIGTTPREVDRAFNSSEIIEKQVANEVTSSIVKQAGLSSDKDMQAYLQAMTDRLAGSADMSDLAYKAILLKDRRMNAFTPGAGKILLNEGLLVHVGSESEVAAVIAHEIAHVIMKDARKLRQYKVVSKFGDALMDGMLREEHDGGAFDRFMRSTGRATLNVFIRGQELRADAIAMDLLVATGYDPAAMVRLHQILRRIAPQPDRFDNIVNGHHPLSEDRIKAARDRIAKFYPGVRGTVTTRKFEELSAPYRAKRLKWVAAGL
jgi:beta-barrel assembly-enhancing protease